MKKYLLFIILFPNLVLGQFDYNEWQDKVNDSLMSINKTTLSVKWATNTFKGDIPNLGNYSFPGHMNSTFGLNLSVPFTKNLNFDINAAYSNLSNNSYSEVANFKGSMIGTDFSVSYNVNKYKRVRPFVGIGIGVGYYNTSKDSLYNGNTPYHHWSDGSIRDLPESYENYFISNEIYYDNDYETSITKGINPYLPITVGARFRLTHNLLATLSYEYIITSDKIDGIQNNKLDAVHQFGVGVGYIFGIKKPQVPKEDSIVINIMVVDSSTQEPLNNCLVKLFKLNMEGQKELIDSAITSNNGNCYLFYPQNLDLYELTFEKDKYYNKEVLLPEHSKNKKTYEEENPSLKIELNSTWKDVHIKGLILDALTNKPLDSVRVDLYEVINGVEVLISSSMSKNDGIIDIFIDHEGDYIIKLDKKQYQSKVFNIPSTDDTENFEILLDGLNPFKMQPEAKKGNKFKIDNIYFAFAKATPIEESFPILDNIVAFMLNNPNARIELGAHTDCVGKEKDNMKLSNARAKACIDYLISKGVPKENLESKGYGETQIINGCYEEGQCTKEENQVNRRVEVKVL